MADESVEDSTFYLEFIIIKVENTLFRVPKTIFDGSSIFEQMFTLPQSGETDGSSNEHPLKLEGISPSEFRIFVKASIPRIVGVELLPTSIEEWASLLRVADMWQIDQLRARVIDDLSTMFDVETAVLQLQLARRYQVDKWLRPALRHLVLRMAPLTSSEFGEIGVELGSRISALREMHLRSHLDYSSLPMISSTGIKVTEVAISLGSPDEEV